MSYLVWLVPIALGMGVVGLMAFLWSMRSGQYEDLDGAAERVLLADAADAPFAIRRGNAMRTTTTWNIRLIDIVCRRARKKGT